MAWGQLDKAAVETCICAVALSLSVVMAGSGHLQTMRLIRGLQPTHPPLIDQAAECTSHGQALLNIPPAVWPHRMLYCWLALFTDLFPFSCRAVHAADA